MSQVLIAMFRLLEGDVDVDPQHPLMIGGSLAIESRLHVRLQTAKQPAAEQMFEDTGSAAFSRCRSAPSAKPAKPAHHFGDCPDGFF